MSNSNSNPNRSSFFFLILLLAVMGAGYYLISSIQESARQALNPVQQANNQLQTQVSSLMHPTPTIIADPVIYIQEVRALARIETIRYSIERVIRAEENQGTFGFLFGDQLLFVAHGVVIAGVDMEKMQPADMHQENGVLYVRLPAAEVFIATLDNQKSYVYDRNTGLMASASKDLETQARQVAEQKILEAALEDGILAQAQTNAETFLNKFFQSLGYQSVVFVK
jgi:hypothetical protein